MSMTREEIIKEYENAVVASGLAAAAGNEDAAKSYELFKAGLSALRPVSLEKADDDDPVSQRLVNMAKNVVRSHTAEYFAGNALSYADRIRASSDEQLALFFKELMFNDFKPACKKSTFFSAEHKPECEEDCVSCILKLLQQPAEEDT